MVEQTSGRVLGGSVRVLHFALRQPSWVMRLMMFVAVLVLLALIAVVVIPVMVGGAAVVLALITTARVRARFGGARSINSALDGRRNVRVIVRD